MKRILGRVYSRLPGRWQRGIKSALWSAVVKMDASLQKKVAIDSIDAPATAAVDTPQATLRPFDASAVHVVDNKEWFISSRGDVELMVSAIFATDDFTGLTREALAYVSARPECWVDRTLLIERLREFLMKELDATSTERGQEAAECLQKLIGHRGVAAANERAYLADGRTYPNAVFWPNPTYAKAPRSLFTETPIAVTHRFLTKKTAIGSAGSCFAMEIAHRLQADGYNYVVTEPHPGRDGYSNSCARWGIIFNTPSFRQLAEKAFGISETALVAYRERNYGVPRPISRRHRIWFGRRIPVDLSLPPRRRSTRIRAGRSVRFHAGNERGMAAQVERGGAVEGTLAHLERSGRASRDDCGRECRRAAEHAKYAPSVKPHHQGHRQCFSGSSARNIPSR